MSAAGVPDDGARGPSDALVEKLQQLLAEAEAHRVEHDRLIQDLQVHQIELEMQNRELREVQGALEASRARFEDLYDFAPIAYLTLDDQGTIREINLTGATMLRRERLALLGAPLIGQVAFTSPARFWDHLRRCRTLGSSVVSELEFAVHGGTPIHVRAISVPVADVAGRPHGYRTAFIDVSDRHQAEAARNRALHTERVLRRELEMLDRAKAVLSLSLATVPGQRVEAVLQVAVEQARIVADADYAMLGLDGHGDQPFSTWVQDGAPPAQAAAVGRPPRPIGTLAVPADGAVLRTAAVTDEPAFGGFPRHHPAITSFLRVPVTLAGRVVGVLCLGNKRSAPAFTADDQRAIASLARDVGAALEIARLGVDARAAVASRDELLAIVSHDLRSPLSTITLCADLLMLTDDPTVAHRQAATIKRASSRMTRLIDDLLTATSIESGHLEVVPHPESIAGLVNEAIEALGPLAVAAAVVLEARLPPRIPEVACDRHRILQVLTNVVVNALRFTPAGGRIRIEIEAVAEGVQVHIDDTGPGIATTEREELFLRHWRGRTRTDHGGLGLGLYICRGIVERHGGRIWASDAPGGGCRISFTLPYAAPPALAA
ncbi:MAG: GAF domain-containing protein [Deltaproteobacteria bacterium]|nr:GAF domain-containing protein [Deltaproteobacteria bacterium]